MIPEATYEYEMKSSWGGDSGRVQQLYGLQARCGHLTTWTILQDDDPDHLGLRCSAPP